MWRLTLMQLIKALLFVCLLFGIPFWVSAAEIFQVQSSTQLQVGDQNRTYTVRLSCLDVDPLKEDEAKNWLKSKLPRRRKVNLRPEGTKEGILIARVTPLGDENDLSKAMSLEGFASLNCLSELDLDDKS